MKNLIDLVEDTLERYDKLKEPFHEIKICDDLREIKKTDLESNEDEEFVYRAEYLAFSIVGNYADSDTKWTDYYGPTMTGYDKDGNFYESPSRELINHKILNYWAERTIRVKNPYLKLRYSDLVWDLTKFITNNNPDIQYANIAINSIIEIINNNLYVLDSQDTLLKLNRALNLAIRINNQDKISQLIIIIIDFEDKISIHENELKAGLWGFSFDYLIENPKVVLTSKQENKIIQDLEQRLNRLSDRSNDVLSPYTCQSISIRLAKYYRKKV